MRMHKSITIMIPAYNEEKNLEKAIDKFDKAVREVFYDYEFLIFDDCSSDRTGEIADELARKNKKIRVIHNKKNRGIGYNYREGVRLSEKDYYTMIPGEGEVVGNSVKELLSHAGEADILIPYIENLEIRAVHRRIISRGFTNLLNTLFALKVNYYLGSVVHRTGLLKKVNMRTNSSAYQAEILVKLLKKGCSYKQLPYKVEKSTGSTTFRVSNLLGVLSTVAGLLFDVYCKGGRRGSDKV